LDFVDGTLTRVKEAAESFGTPLYLYFPDLIQERITRLKAACPEFGVRYAVKTNPNPWLLKWMQGRVESLDVSSSGEVKKALGAGWQGQDIEFTGPAKTRKDLELALAAQVHSIVVEDITEAQLLNDICREQGKRTRILVRIAPMLAEEKFGVRLAGRATQFGVDEDKLSEFFRQVDALENVWIDGLHIYSGSQCLDDDAMVKHFNSMWATFKKALSMLDKPVSELVFGAGMGIPYHDGDPSLSLAPLNECVNAIQQEIRALGFPVRCFVELGRFLVGEAGLFVTEVVRVKESRDNLIAICDGGMNNNLGACGHMGGISHRHYSMRLVSQSSRASDTQRYKVVGPLCTAIDTLAHRIDLPTVAAGDYIAVGCAGSYGPSASPLYFISHGLPKEVVYHGGSEAAFEEITWLSEHAVD